MASLAIWVYLVLLLALTGHSSAAYCICKDGVSEQALQKTIDYACGSGADCSAILQNGACYQPNTVKDHCNYAANSYYQRKGQSGATCDFSGTATTSSTIPNQASGCVYPSSASSAGTSTNTPSSATTTTAAGGTTPYSGLGPSGFSDSSSAAGLFQGFSSALFLAVLGGFLLL